MIFINRKIFLNLSDELKAEYINDCIANHYDFTISVIEPLAITIKKIIEKNEAIIEKFGWDSYVSEEYPAKYHCSGYGYLGKTVIVPFDWSADSLDELNYSFVLSEII